MSDRDKGRLVYSTGLGSICPGCGWPDKDCKCSSQQAASDAIPKRIVAKLRMEKKGRGGKTVTVVDGLPNNAALRIPRSCQTIPIATMPCSVATKDSSARTASVWRGTIASSQSPGMPAPTG
jgi:hypothetical protein